MDACPNFELHFRRALQSLPSDEVTKQERFHFRNDSLACVAARIMIRAATCSVLNISWHDVIVDKSDRGKPFLPGNPMNFNISHQGDLVVLASSRKYPIGVDVMKINEERNLSASDHINQMKKLFSKEELNMMMSGEDETSRWTSFYRIWCLKEAVLKATGVGLVNDLNMHSFSCSTMENHSPGCFITNTSYSYNGAQQDKWHFEESFIGSDHCVAVGKIYPSFKEAAQAKLRPKQFEMVSLAFLLEKSTSLSEDDPTFYERYIKKPWKTF